MSFVISSLLNIYPNLCQILDEAVVATVTQLIVIFVFNFLFAAQEPHSQPLVLHISAHAVIRWRRDRNGRSFYSGERCCLPSVKAFHVLNSAGRTGVQVGDTLQLLGQDIYDGYIRRKEVLVLPIPD